MRKKFVKFGLVCIALAAVLFAVAFVLYHYLTDTGFVAAWQPEPGKPFVTEMVGDLGVLLLGSGILSLLAGKVFDPEGK